MVLFKRFRETIYTKAADVGPDSVRKVNEGFGEDSPQTLIIITDNICDNDLSYY